MPPDPLKVIVSVSLIASPSSAAVTVTVCAVEKFEAVKVKEVFERLTSELVFVKRDRHIRIRGDAESDREIPPCRVALVDVQRPRRTDP